MDEATKTLSLYPDLLSPYLQGRVLDIGAGLDPITPQAEVFDKEQGDAQYLDRYFPSGGFDTVFSSHCLEHMVDPIGALKSWFALVKPGGYLVTIVPDEDLYEQGHFPSLFNSDHKSTFTLSKSKSWSPRSNNCFELAQNLPGEIIYLALQDNNYNRSRMTSGFFGILRFRILAYLLRFESFSHISIRLRLRPIDQTSLNDNVLAQIIFIVRKR